LKRKTNKTVWFAVLALGVFLVPSNPLGFALRFPTAPDPGSWANPYDATDPVTGQHFELKPRLMEHGTDVDERFPPGSIQNPWELDRR
jgi:hypothetical protein